jgi:hypothetical protein
MDPMCYSCGQPATVEVKCPKCGGAKWLCARCADAPSGRVRKVPMREDLLQSHLALCKGPKVKPEGEAS